MDPFELPDELPAGVEDLTALRAAAQEAFSRLRGKVDGGETLSDEELDQLRYVVSAGKTLDAALAAASDATGRDEEISQLLAEGQPEGDEPEGDDDGEETDPEGGEEVVEEAEAITEAAASVTAAAGKSATKQVARKQTSFAGMQKGKTPTHIPRGTGSTDNVGFRMYDSMINPSRELVGFAEIAASIDAVKKGHRPRGNVRQEGAYASLPLFALERGDMPVVEDSHALVAAIKEATDLSNLRPASFDKNGSLTAAGGWCAPSEQLYDFCEVPLATDLVALPEITIRRGGVRWPIEPDLSSIFESFEFFFTEPELEAIPAPVKECVEIPCPDEFNEIRLSAVGYCVEAGILQTQGWPELIDWFMRSITQEHFRALSRRTILNMVSGSTPISLTTAALGVSAASSVLNTLELMAINLRLNKGYARGYPIEGVAPNWLHALIRADFAQQQGLDIKSVTDAQIDAWFSARGIRFQFVADWQTREAGMPGNLATLQWPGSVSVLMYPAGTWFRSLSNVIEFGVQYPRELLQLNRYSRFFTEDAYAVAKRCDESLVVTIPTCVNGGYGGPITVTCNTPADEVQALATSGSPTGGTVTLTFEGQSTAPIAYNATAAAVQSALEALTNVNVGDVTAAGGALGTAPVTMTFGGRFKGANVPKMTVTSALTGGTNPTATVTVTTEGGS
jgi:hypothetical protein